MEYVWIAGEQNSGKTTACNDLADYLETQGGQKEIVTITEKNYSDTLKKLSGTSYSSRAHAIRKRPKNNESFIIVVYKGKIYLICPRGDNIASIEEVEIVYFYLTLIVKRNIDYVIFTSRSKPNKVIKNSVYSRAEQTAKLFGENNGICLKTTIGNNATEIDKHRKKILSDIKKALSV